MSDLPAWLVAVRQNQVRTQPAWQRQPEAQPGYTPPRPRPRQMRPAIARLYDPNQGVRDQATQQVRQERELAQLSQRAAGGHSGYADRNQVEEFGRGLVEATGAPSWARGIDHVANQQPGEAIPDFLWGAVNTAGIATLPLVGGTRVPTRPAPPPRITAPVEQPIPMRAPQMETPPLRPPATASPDAGQSGAGQRRVPLTELSRQDPLNATFPWEQRNTPTDEMVRDALARGAVRGAGSDAEVSSWGAREHAERIATLMRDGWSDPISLRRVERRLAVDDGYHRLAAARLRGDADILASAPDGGASGAGNAYREQLRGDGFDVDRVLYHGTAGAFDDFRPGEAVWLSPNPAEANAYAARSAEVFGRGAPNVRPVYARNVEGSGDHLFVRSADDIRPQFGEARAPNAGPSRPPPRPRPPPRRQQ